MIGEAKELTSDCPLPPSNLSILKHLSFKRKQMRKSAVIPYTSLLLNVADELVAMCARRHITAYPRLLIFQ